MGEHASIVANAMTLSSMILILVEALAPWNKLLNSNSFQQPTNKLMGNKRRRNSFSGEDIIIFFFGINGCCCFRFTFISVPPAGH